MNRQTILIVALVGILVLVAYWFLLLSPKRSEKADVEAQIESVQTQQQQLQSRLSQLREVRRQAPELEAFLSASQSLIPPDPALPATLRSLQLAADASGVTLSTISPGTPAGGDDASIQTMSLSLTVSGGYYQIVDLLRRIEDPSIVSRALVFNTVSLAPSEYPILTASLGGEMYVAPPTAPAEGG